VKLSSIGEFGLIQNLSKLIGKARQPVVIGVGDDCAVIGGSGDRGIRKTGTYCLITTDTLVEKVHFKLHNDIAEYKVLGKKAMAANISDIAAMGGWPTFAVVTIGAKKNTSVEAITALYRGMLSLAKKHNIQIIGGDTVSSPLGLMISITLLGEVEKQYMLTRSGAKVGDVILVTGKFGGEAVRRFDIRKSKIENRCRDARIIAKSRLASAMIDSSDGLVRSVSEICRASKIGARINPDLVPIAFGANLEQALYGGEEYELVFTVPKTKANKLKSLLWKKLRSRISIVGEIVGKGIRLENSLGNRIKLKNGGYEHFR